MKNLIILVCFFSVVGLAFGLPIILTNSNFEENVEKVSLEEYSGEILNLVFEPLLTYPAIALSSENVFKEHNEENCLTPNQFRELLHLLEEKNYVVVNINNLVENGSPLLLPSGKKPVVLSFYDVSKNKSLGTTEKIIVSNSGAFLCETNVSWANPPFLDQNENDYVSILENFSKENPSFFVEPSKGTIILNSENGFLGYKTQETNTENRQQEIFSAEIVINKLVEAGWTFKNYIYSPEMLSPPNSLKTVIVNPKNYKTILNANKKKRSK